MTFTEAAIEVLRREGKPLHFKKLTEIAIRENLLDHVGKVPDDTMAGLLAAHCRLPRPERKLLPVQLGTFALAEWGLEEDPAGLEGIGEAPPEDELPYRARERHPTPTRELSRGGGGRGEPRPRRHEEERERRGRRFPPPAEVAYEILAGAGRPLPVSEIAATGAERLLMPDAFVQDAGALRSALDEDNRRRESAGRKPLFQLDGELVTLVAQPEPGERPAPISAAPRALVAVGAMPAGELRRSGLAALRRRLRDCDGPTVEHVTLRLLEKLGFRDVKVAKRGREHVVCTARKRMGISDVRHAVRILRGGADAARRDVTDLRRDLGHYGAQIGIVVSAGEAGRDARGDAAAAGQLPVVLLCGEGLAEALAEVSLGCVPVVVPEVDEAFFRAATEEASREEEARRARREERDRRDGGERGEREERSDRRGPRETAEPERDEASFADFDTRVLATVPADRADSTDASVAGGPPASVTAAVAALVEGDDAAAIPDAEDEGDADEEGEEEGSETEAAGAAGGATGEPGTPGGERRKRRRRRRRRGGRGRGAREGAPAQGEAGASAAPAGAPEAPASGTPERAEPPPLPPLLPPPPRDPPAGEGA